MRTDQRAAGVRRILIGVLAALAVLAIACAEDPEEAAPRSSGLAAGVPASGPRADHVVDPIPAIELDETNTGLRGAIAAGLYPGDADDPYGELRVLDGEVVIDEDWIKNENGGRRIIEGIDVQGALIVATTDVIVRYCRVRGDQSVFYTVQNNNIEAGDGSRFELAWCEVFFDNPDGKAVLGRNMTVYRSHVRGGQDGIHVNDGGASPGPVTIEQSFVHDQFRPPEHHSDGIQFNGDPGGPVRITANKVINHLEDANAPLMLSGLEDIVVEGNYFWGGVYYLVGGIDGTLVSRNNMLAWGSTLFGMYGVSGDVTVEGDVWAPWVDPEMIDEAGEPIATEPMMPPDDGMIGQPAIDDAPGDP